MEGRRYTWYAAALLLLMMVDVVGCAARRPVLYPNEHLNRVGAATAERDVDECMRRADEYSSSGGGGGEVARDTAKGAGVGAAAGAVGGAIWGNAGRGAASGAAGGATAGLLSGLIGKREPSPAYTKFVTQCLHDKGYQPIGWQ